MEQRIQAVKVCRVELASLVRPDADPWVVVELDSGHTYRTKADEAPKVGDPLRLTLDDDEPELPFAAEDQVTLTDARRAVGEFGSLTS